MNKFSAMLRAIALARITAHEQRLVFYMLGVSGMENAWWEMYQRKIGRDLEIDPSNVSRALKRLADRGVLLKKEVRGVKYYAFNLDFGSSSNVASIADARRRWEAA